MRGVEVSIRSGRPLASTQRALVASQQRHPDAPVQNTVHLIHVAGELDPERFADAFARVVAGSDALRARVALGPDGVPSIRLDATPASTEVVVIPRGAARAWAAARARRPLSLTDHAFDSVLLLHDDGTTSWYLALHHVVCDAAAADLVVLHTADAYAGKAVELASFFDWIENASAGPAQQRAVTHWAERTRSPRLGHLYERGLPTTSANTRTRLPLDELDPLLEQRLSQELRALTSDLAWTTLLATATAAYLYRITAATTFALGVPVHNRSRPETRSLIGPLMEVYPLDVSVEPDDTFITLHERVRRSLNQTLRFAQPGSAPATSDVEVVINVVPEPTVDDFAGLAAAVEQIHSGAVDSSHLLRVQLSRYGSPEIWLDTNDAAVAPGRTARAAHHFETVLRSLLEDPSSRVADFDLCHDGELAALDAWGSTPPLQGSRPSVIEALEHALASSDSTVLEAGQRTWTGRELWAWVEETADRLAADGAGPGNRVGVLLPRSAEAVVAMLASMRAGASYVPLDPGHPPARTDRLIERAGCTVVVREVLPPTGSSPAAAWPPAALTDEAYVLFTSGSTGEPKGVPISHQGLADYLAFAEEAYVDPDAPPVAPLFSPLTFDLTVTSLYLPLLTGGRLVVIEADGPAGVAEVAARTDLTWAKATPSHLEILLRLLPRDHALSRLVVGGEAFVTSLVHQLWDVLPDLRMWNEYGPTEAVVGCMIHEARRVDEPPGPDVPIGRPAPGVTLSIEDAAGRRVPIGCVGELMISSPGLSPGYLDGESTAFVTRSDGRWYRSGDLVRMLDDETLVYLRRADEQLKVGGIRLDPSEIEAALLTHPAVRRAAVRAWAPSHRPPGRYCTRCGLADNVPGVRFDDAGVCDRCHAYDAVKDQAESWFGTPDDLLALRDEARRKRTGGYDCIALLSGGKDSTYTVYQLVRMGFEVFALTLDNGFISDEAKANIARTVDHLGIDHELATTDAMPAIFRDSLERHSNVCHGCFKTIYTLGTNRAVELGAPLVVTGLSRGQLFETRLIPAQFSEGRFDPDEIDAAVVAARKVYHRADDTVRRLLDTSAFADDELFDRITYVDFYRYVDVELAEMLRFLEQEAPWVRPSDTGRSTNCRINAAGISTHLHEQGYHNYAEPYAWDVRLGHKQRDEALAELDDRDEATEVAAMLEEVGYLPRRRETLTAWLELQPGSDPPAPSLLRAHLQQLLPAHAVPSAFVSVDALPMTTNGKLDIDALPEPDRIHRSSPTVVVTPSTPLERRIVNLWERRLGIEPLSVDDDFFGLGGDSMDALAMTSALAAELDMAVADSAVFANPTPRALAAHLAGTAGPALGAAPIAGQGGTPPAPSIGERAMWFEHVSDPGNLRYNMARLYRISGAVDTTRLCDALHVVVARHQPLHWTHGEERRQLSPDDAVEVHTADYADWETARAWATALQLEPFDLRSGPLTRCGIATVGSDDTAVVLATHHIATDATSFDRFWSELDRVYRGESLPELDIGYADHAAWQAQHLAERGLGAWQPPTEPPVRIGFATPPPGTADGFLTRPATVAASELRSAGTAPLAAILAAVAAALVPAVTGDRVSVGVLTSVRDHASAEPLVGYYLNTMPITLEVPGSSMLAEVRSAAAERLGRLLDTRTVPMAHMVAEARRRGMPDPTPQVLLAFEEVSGITLGDLTAEQENMPSGFAVADATVFAQISDDHLSLSIEHRGSVIDGVGAERLLADIDAALTAVVRAPAQRCDELTLPSTRGSVIAGPALTEPTTHVVTAIAAAAVERGDAAAVICGGRTLSWNELDVAAAATAARLIDAGVRPGERVVVHLPRSPELIVAISAVLRAGAAYVPLDPTYPPARNQAVVAAAQARVIIDTGEGPALGDDLVRIGVSDPRTAPTAEALPAPDLDDVAYVLFTSGSTGDPRGVPVTHRNLAHSNAARVQAYGGRPERFLLISSVAFDSSVAGIFWTLTTGGTLVLPDDDEARDVEAIGGLVRHQRITHTLLVPTLYAAVLRHNAPGGHWPDTVIVAGESCTPELVTAHHAARPASALVNEYGPTEATVWATWTRTEPGRAVSIGSPIPGSWVAVVDPAGRPVPEGVVGELVIGGPTVTGRYDDGTEAGFTELPDIATGPVFRSGDLAHASGGMLWFHGRIDDQLNIGGIRVEPAEIECVLRAAARADTVVVAQDPRPLGRRIDDAGPARLSQALVAASTEPDPAVALARLLSDPAHLVLVAHIADLDADLDGLRTAALETLRPGARPNVYVRHGALPRLPNGKVDRSALADHIPDVTEPDHHGHADVGPDMEAFVMLWREVLDDPGLSADDDFFARGGDSLKALDLLEAIEHTHGLRPRVSALFEARTPRALHRELGLGTGTGSGRSPHAALVVRPGSSSRQPLWVFPGAGGTLLEFEPIVDRLDPDLRVMGVEYPGAHGDEEPADSLEMIADHYLEALRAEQPSGPYRFVGYSLGGLVALEVTKRLRAEGQDVTMLMAIESGIAGADTGRTKRRLLTCAYREGGMRALAGSFRWMVEARVRYGRDQLRTRAEQLAAERLGLQPSRQERFALMIATSAQSGLAYAPPTVDVDIDLVLADESDALWVEGMTRQWAETTGRDLRVARSAGSHHHDTMLRPPHVESLAHLLRQALERAG